MPIPFILAGIGAIAAAAGIGGHMEAKETNELANSISRDAQRLYDNAKDSLEIAQENAKSSLSNFECTQNKISETSIKTFMDAVCRVKIAEKADELNQLSGVNLDDSFMIELKNLQGVYSSSISTGLAGAAIGSALALAGSGMLPIIGSTLSLAAGALSFGGIGAAATLTGSALSMAASATPLAAIAAPVLLFTAFSANDKADENLEKARANYAQAEAVAAEMSISETMCNAIVKRADMFDNLINELNGYFSPMTALFDQITTSRCNALNKEMLDRSDFNESELKIIAVCLSIFQSIISIMRVPFFSEDGQLSIEAEDIYDKQSEALLDFSEQSSPDSIAALAEEMKQNAVLLLNRKNDELLSQLHILKEISYDNETLSEIYKAEKFIANIMQKNQYSADVNYHFSHASAQEAFMKASKLSREINETALVLDSMHSLVTVKIVQYNSLDKYYTAEKNMHQSIEQLNITRSTFINEHIKKLLTSYHRLNGFFPSEIRDYIVSDTSLFNEYTVETANFDTIQFSIIPEDYHSANKTFLEISNYCSEVQSASSTYRAISLIAKYYESLFSCESIDIFKQMSAKIEQLITEKKAILGTSELTPINFTKSEKALLSFSLQSYYHIKHILSLKLTDDSGTAITDTDSVCNDIKRESANIRSRYNVYSAMDYSQTPIKTRFNTFYGNVIFIAAIAIIAIIILFSIHSIIPKAVIIIGVMLIIAFIYAGFINIRSRSRCYLS